MATIVKHSSSVAGVNASTLADKRTVKALEILKGAASWDVTVFTHKGKSVSAFLIQGTDAAPYTVNENACTCPDFTRRYRFQKANGYEVSKHLACKHMLAVRMFITLSRASRANVMAPKELS